MEGFIFSNPERKYKEAFKNQTDRLFRLLQSKPVKVAGETFYLVGQSRLKSYWLTSHFDVFDSIGQSANEDDAKKVHLFLSRLCIAGVLLSPLRKATKKLLNSDITVEAINNEFKLPDESYSKKLIELNQPTYHALDRFIEVISKIYNKDAFTEEDIEVVNKEWNMLWEILKKRTVILYELYANNRKWKRLSTTDQCLQDLFEEASLTYKGYRELSVIKIRGTSLTVDELIHHNYQIGRLQQDEPTLHNSYKVHRFLYGFIRIFVNIIWLIFLPFVGISLYWANELSGQTMFPLMSFGLIALVIRGRIKKHLLMNIQSDLLEHSENIIYENAQEKVMEDNDIKKADLIKPKVLFETEGLFMGLRLVFGLFAIAFSVVIYLILSLDISTLTLIILIMVNILLWLMVFVYPQLPFIGRKFIVTESLVHIQKDKFSPDQFIRIIKKKNDIDFHFYTQRHPAPYEIRIKREEKEKLAKVLRTWTEINDIPFHE